MILTAACLAFMAPGNHGCMKTNSNLPEIDRSHDQNQDQYEHNSLFLRIGNIYWFLERLCPSLIIQCGQDQVKMPEIDRSHDQHRISMNITLCFQELENTYWFIAQEEVYACMVLQCGQGQVKFCQKLTDLMINIRMSMDIILGFQEYWGIFIDFQRWNW